MSLERLRVELEQLENPIISSLRVRSPLGFQEEMYEGVQNPLEQQLQKLRCKQDHNLPLMNDVVREYIALLPKICYGERNSQIENVVSADSECLQKLAQRIALGRDIAEAKYQAGEEKKQDDPDYQNPYDSLIQAQDRKGIEDAIRDNGKEAEVLDRIGKKAETRGLDREVIVEFFTTVIIPLTIEVEIECLLAKALPHPGPQAQPVQNPEYRLPPVE